MEALLMLHIEFEIFFRHTLYIFVKGFMQIFKIIITLFISSYAAFGQAQSSVWKVEAEGGNHLYIGGTVHVLSANDFPLPAEFNEAFNDSDILVLETDMARMNAPEFQAQTLMAMMYTDGRTLQSVLSPDIFAKLEAYLAEKGLSAMPMNMLKAGGMSLTLTMLELQSMGINMQGVDAYYDRIAREKGMAIDMFETPEEQLAFLSGLGEGNEDEIIAYTLEDMAELPAMMEQLTAAWRVGDLNKLDELLLDEMEAEFPEVFQTMFLERNLRWIPQIEQMLETEPAESVFVGAGHLAGEDGLINLLTERGYKVEQL